MLIDKIRSTIKKYNMLQGHDKVLVGLSGGPDSVVLLHALYSLKRQYFLTIYIAHLDHKFRGEESRSDRIFCEKLASELNLEIFCDEIDVPAIVEEKGVSPEEAARIERYNFFRKVAGTKNIKKIAVGHTRDDQAETVLMRVIRGSGIAGLGAISPVKDIQGLTVIRPLIETSRCEIENYVRKNNLQFRHDSTNDKILFTRNRVRHELIPYLEQEFNPNIKEVLTNMAENLRTENEFLEKFAKRKFRSTSRVKNSEILIDLNRFKKQPVAIRKRVLRIALQELKGDLRRFTYQHWKEMEELIGTRPVNSKVDLPGGLDIVKKRGSLIISKT